MSEDAPEYKTRRPKKSPTAWVMYHGPGGAKKKNLTLRIRDDGSVEVGENAKKEMLEEAITRALRWARIYTGWKITIEKSP